MELGFFESAPLVATTYPIDSAAGSITVVGANPAKRWICFHLFLQTVAASILQVDSGAIHLSGAIPFTAGEEHDWKNGGFPVFCGRAVNQAMIVTNSLPTGVKGFAVVAEIDR